ncbi:MAG: hypothetical protein IKR86_06965 [Candidatus Methanomethylophilaceae archaeon]|jgi:hypothetical protein|nr:hypothetical protein [Candidatus Methanomethylophilaceae archaeon]
MRRFLVIAVVLLTAVMAKAQDNANRIGVGATAYYRPAASAILSWEHETAYHNAWEVFATGSLKLDNLDDIKSNNKAWGVGAAWKPCLYRAKNRYGSARIGVSIGAAPVDFLAGIHAGWQHSYTLKSGWQFYWQAGVDLMLPRRDDLFRAGAGIGVKLPVRDRLRYR